jgi:N-acetylglucosaminyl-diphospho-decaprenol L-rhamnosyltransferase
VSGDRPPHLSVLLVTSHQGWPLTARAIEALLPQDAPGCRIEIVLVDNASTDASAKIVAAAYPAVRYLRLDRNYGFAIGNNRGLALCRAPLIFILNNDTEAEPGALKALVDAAADHPGFDVFAAQMVRLARPAEVDNRGIYLDATGHLRQLDSGAPVEGGPGPVEVFGPSGGAAGVRRSLIERIGLYDETLGTYIEDGDFACRARAEGARCLYVPDARIRHVGSATMGRMPDHKLHLIQRNLRVIRRRWLAAGPWTRTFWLSHAYEWLQIAKAARAGQLATIRRAIRDAGGFRSEADRWATPEARRRVAAWIGVRARPLTSA